MLAVTVPSLTPSQVNSKLPLMEPWSWLCLTCKLAVAAHLMFLAGLAVSN